MLIDFKANVPEQKVPARVILEFHSAGVTLMCSSDCVAPTVLEKLRTAVISMGYSEKEGDECQDRR